MFKSAIGDRQNLMDFMNFQGSETGFVDLVNVDGYACGIWHANLHFIKL